MRAGLLVIALAAVAGGCDWRDFDSLQNDTPARAIDAPSGYPSGTDFAQLLVPTAPPADGSAAARFVTSGTVQTAVSVVTLNSAGQPSAHLVSPSASGLANLSGQPVTALAAIPGTDKVLLGVPSPVGGTILTLDLSQSPETVSTFAGISPLAQAEPALGAGIAAGNVGGAGTSDLIVLSAGSIHVYLDGGTTELSAASSTACPIALSASLPARQRVQRAVAIGSLVGTGPVIAVGTPGVGGGGAVSFFGVDAAGTSVSCLLTLTAPSAVPGFGRSLAVGDFNGDGAADLMVGAPPDRAYLYAGPIAAGAMPAGSFSNVMSAGYTGASVAALDLDGKPGDEALIGDPDGSAGTNVLGAGDVMAVSGSLTTVIRALAEHSAGSTDAYGSSVAALPFCAAAPCSAPRLLPLVGAANRAFVYFTLSGDDPRSR